ncbi:alpha/beta fold hydrolase [Serpentinicella sp. ANB-PHB4]|uniref:alpha/beta fold hydrolase n=1 Tax=Serpentinicella sp. ANB-PHB4 TaxID=3074076 RepID=UPI00285D76D0|nr:alpha/beta fold hydrolase [Serpentinicella sp. ANB-PHB4]MDR5659855.1 alpha/beta fold hydrolase [Serpentinicella sp. ANB-PHB4]
MNQYHLVDVNEIKLAGIPCIHIKPNFINENLPTVVLYHGWSSNKENFKFIGTILAQNGYRVVIPDSIDHGERGALDYESIEVMQANFWRVVFQSVNEFTDLITEAIKTLDVDNNKIAVMGSSMGGFISSGIFAQNENIKCLVNMNGACAWENAEYHFRKLHNLEFATGEQMEYIKANDPIKSKDTFRQRGILLLHGDSDTQVPIDTQRYFYNEIKDMYKSSENIQLIESPNLDHYKTVKMIEDSLDWLNRFLK